MSANSHIIIILVSSEPLDLEILEKKEKMQKVDYVKNETNFLDRTKRLFHKL